MGTEMREREFRAGIRAAKEFNKSEVIFIGDNEGIEERDGVKFRLIPFREWLLGAE